MGRLRLLQLSVDDVRSLIEVQSKSIASCLLGELQGGTRFLFC